MTLDRSQDASERRRLETLVDRLSNSELATPLADGWTVAGVLAHLAFWDQRVAFLLGRWQRDGVGPSEADTDAINNAAKPQWLALPPRDAAALAVAAARAADAAVDAASPALIDQIVSIGAPISLSRADHRREHLDEIERALRL